MTGYLSHLCPSNTSLPSSSPVDESSVLPVSELPDDGEESSCWMCGTYRLWACRVGRWGWCRGVPSGVLENMSILLCFIKRVCKHSLTGQVFFTHKTVFKSLCAKCFTSTHNFKSITTTKGTYSGGVYVLAVMPPNWTLCCVVSTLSAVSEWLRTCCSSTFNISAGALHRRIVTVYWPY